MAHAVAKDSIFIQPEYSVYIYHLPENQIEGHNDWEMRTHTQDLRAAIDEARSLHSSQSYRKVEIKERTLDPKTETFKDKTLKIYRLEYKARPFKRMVFSIGIVLTSSLFVWSVFKLV